MPHDLHTLLDALRGQLQRAVVTVGNFDGVHLGHQAILADVVREARQRQAPSVALTFEPHPVTFFRKGDEAAFRLTDAAQKERLLRQLGVDHPIALPFGPELAALTPEEFVGDILAGVLDSASVRVGYDFNFGRGRAGTPEVLRALGEARGMQVHIHPPVAEGGQVVSSTAVRRALQRGELAEASALLGRHHPLWGEVEQGDARGRRLGFPTANLSPGAGLLVPHGVYVTALVDRRSGARWPGITNIGVRPTFGDGAAVNVETFVLEGLPPEADLYGTPVAVELLSWIREERTFPDPAALIAQIQLDLGVARQRHGIAP